MSERNTVIRSMHDLGLAAWFGGSLMGAVGLNGATSKAKDPTERLSLSSDGWARWAPVQLGALVVHAIGGVGLILSNKTRLAGQEEARVNAIVKGSITVAAAAASLYSGILGARMGARYQEGTIGVTEPSPAASDELASAQRQQRILQWVLPALTGIVIILSAQQGEQQRPIAGLLKSFGRK